MALSSHGICLKPLSGGVQQLRDGGEVPGTVLRPEVPEVDREVRKQGLHVLALLIQQRSTGDGEGMPKRHQAGSPPPLRRLESQALAESSESVMQGKIP